MTYIALFCTSLSGGGAERVLLNLAEGFIASGHMVDLVLIHKEGEYLEQVPDGVNIIDLQAANNIHAMIKFWGYVHKSRPDVVVSTLLPASQAAIIVQKFLKKKHRLFVRVDNTLSREMEDVSWRKYLRVKWLYPLAQHFITVSNGVADDLESYLNIPRHKIHTIYNPMQIEAIQMQAKQAISHTWFDAEVPLIITMGRLASQKNMELLIETVAAIRQQCEVRLMILGKGEQEDYLCSLVHRLQLDEVVEFLGFQPNPYAYLAQADLFVLPSLFEGFGNVIVEALACGVPVVSTDCPHGPAEILEQGKYGILVPPGDRNALGKAILEALDTQHDKERLKGRAQEFSMETILPNYYKVLEL